MISVVTRDVIQKVGTERSILAASAAILTRGKNSRRHTATTDAVILSAGADDVTLTVVVGDDAGDVGVDHAVERLGRVAVAVPGQPVAPRHSSAVNLSRDAAVLVQTVPAQTAERGGRNGKEGGEREIA